MCQENQQVLLLDHQNCWRRSLIEAGKEMANILYPLNSIIDTLCSSQQQDWFLCSNLKLVLTPCILYIWIPCMKHGLFNLLSALNINRIIIILNRSANCLFWRFKNFICLVPQIVLYFFQLKSWLYQEPFCKIYAIMKMKSKIE